MSDNEKRRDNFAATYCYALGDEPVPWDDCDWQEGDITAGGDHIPRYAYLYSERGDDGSVFVSFSDDLGELSECAGYDVHGPRSFYPLALLDLDECTVQWVRVKVTYSDPVNARGTAAA